MKNDLQVTVHDFLIYRDDNEDIKVNFLINNDIQLTQNLIVELFGVGRSTITELIDNILSSGELKEETSVGISDESTGGRKSKVEQIKKKLERRKNIGAFKESKEFLYNRQISQDEFFKTDKNAEDWLTRIKKFVQIMEDLL